MNRLGHTDLLVSPLCLGGNVFGWTADQEASFAILDAYRDAGGNFIDTAEWVPGNKGGESEAIIGRWLARRGERDQLVIATKVGQSEHRGGLSRDVILAAAEESLRRLGTDWIDLYYAHEDDPSTSLEETIGAFDELVHAGKVRHVAASNYSAPRLAEALATADRLNATRYCTLQVHYNLVHRSEYEGDLALLCEREEVAGIAYYALANGFLTGKYRGGKPMPHSERADDATPYLNDKGSAMLLALDEVAAVHEAPVAAVALAWLLAQPTMVAVAASARTPQQLAELLKGPELHLSEHDIAAIDAVGTG
jgi:aryl-alcohol dehydrogenase-like predicted oxidoreductase